MGLERKEFLEENKGVTRLFQDAVGLSESLLDYICDERCSGMTCLQAEVNLIAG